MVMTAGATRRKDVEEVLVNEKDEMVGEYDANSPGYAAIDGKYHLLTTSGKPRVWQWWQARLQNT